MTTPINPIPTLLSRCAEQILSHGLEGALTLTRRQLLNADPLHRLWSDLKSNVPSSVLRFERQISKIEKQQQYQTHSGTIPKGFKTSTLFRQLKKKNLPHFTEANITLQSKVPTTSEEYIKLQDILKQKWEEEALITLWKKEICTRLAIAEPGPQTIDEIKVWVSDPSNAPQLGMITELDLQKQQIKAIPPEIVFLTELETLNLRNNTISCIEPLSQLSNLKHLNLESNRISHLTLLENMTHLTRLNLKHNKISDLTPLKNLIDLTRLNLKNNTISTIHPLENLKHLTHLYLDNNPIESIAPLEHCQRLVKLSLINNIITPIDPLENLTHLTHLHLSNNTITNLSPLKNLIHLTHLSLRDNAISDITPIGACVHLVEVDLADNEISLIPTLHKLIQRAPGHPPCEFSIGGNPLMFICDTDPYLVSNEEAETRYQDFQTYKCSSPYSHLLKLITIGTQDLREIQEVFETLPLADRSLIDEIIREQLEGSEDSQSADSQEEEALLSADILFSNMPIFCRALRETISIKVNRSPAKQHNKLYREIYHLAHASEEKWEESFKLEEREELDKIAWGKEHALGNILRFLDAFDNVG